MIRLGDADPVLLDAWMESRSRRALAMSDLVSTPTVSASPRSEPVSKSRPAEFAASLRSMTKVA